LCIKCAENKKRVIFSRKAAKFAKGKMIKNVYKKSLRLCERIFSGLSGLGFPDKKNPLPGQPGNGFNIKKIYNTFTLSGLATLLY